MLIALGFLYSNTLMDDFLNLVSNLGDPPNQRRKTVSVEIIWRLNV